MEWYNGWFSIGLSRYVICSTQCIQVSIYTTERGCCIETDASSCLLRWCVYVLSRNDCGWWEVEWCWSLNADPLYQYMSYPADSIEIHIILLFIFYHFQITCWIDWFQCTILSQWRIIIGIAKDNIWNTIVGLFIAILTRIMDSHIYIIECNSDCGSHLWVVKSIRFESLGTAA